MDEEEKSLGLDIYCVPGTKRFLRCLASVGYVEHADNEDGPWEPVPSFKATQTEQEDGG